MLVYTMRSPKLWTLQPSLSPLREERRLSISEHRVFWKPQIVLVERMMEPEDVEVLDIPGEEEDILTQLNILKERARMITRQFDIPGEESSDVIERKYRIDTNGYKEGDVVEEDIGSESEIDVGSESDVDVVTVDYNGDNLDNLIVQNVRPTLFLVLESSKSLSSEEKEVSLVEEEVSLVEEEVNDLSVDEPPEDLEDETITMPTPTTVTSHQKMPSRRRLYTKHRIFWNMSFRHQLYNDITNPLHQPLSDSEDDTDDVETIKKIHSQEIDQQDLENSVLKQARSNERGDNSNVLDLDPIQVRDLDPIQVRDLDPIHLRDLDPIIFAPTGDIYSFFQRRRFEPDKFTFLLDRTTLLSL